MGKKHEAAVSKLRAAGVVWMWLVGDAGAAGIKRHGPFKARMWDLIIRWTVPLTVWSWKWMPTSRGIGLGARISVWMHNRREGERVGAGDIHPRDRARHGITRMV